MRLLKVALLFLLVSVCNCTFLGLEYVPPRCNDCTARTFFENCCPEPTGPVLADRVELRWGPSANDLDLFVLEYEGPEEDVDVYYEQYEYQDEYYDYDNDNSYCLTSYVKNCSETSLAMDVFTSPGPEIITWNANSKKYVILVEDYSFGGNFFIDSQAEVRIYGQDDSVEIVNVPITPTDNEKRYWTVGCFDGALGLSSLNIINMFQDSPDCVPNSPRAAYTRLQMPKSIIRNFHKNHQKRNPTRKQNKRKNVKNKRKNRTRKNKE